ncbi:MAG: bifunctional nuclease family protein, partial [Chloroflexi bacterium]|nr:bifunctional nuclease family protein [Chloroflexota bacterium]
VRTDSPVFVEEHVLEAAGITPEPEITTEEGASQRGEDDEGDLAAFQELMDDLDLGFLDDEDAVSS